jgi:hypothetical protein
MSIRSLIGRQQKASRSPNHIWAFAPVIILLIAYLFSLEFQYVEGDDASTVIYHAMGRNVSLQSPYSSYHALADTLLHLLPAQEETIRVVAIACSAIANIFVVLLILQLIFDWLLVTDVKIRILTGLIVTIGVPEFFYLGLVYTPTLFAMVFLLLSQLILHRIDFSIRSRNNSFWILLSILLFSIGAAFRWDTVTYGAVIVVDLLFFATHRMTSQFSWRQRLAISVAWGGAALIGWFLVLMLLGFPPSSVFALLGWAGKWRQGFSLLTVVIGQTLLSPLIMLLSAVGLWALLHQRSILLVILGISLVVVAPWLPGGVAKTCFVAIPIILAVSSAGFLMLLHLHNQTLRRFSLAALVIIGLFPWFIGIEARLGDTAWGPGFEMQAFNRPLNDGMSFQLVPLGAGAAVTTSEGPRALFGHFAAIFGGQWRTLIQTQNAEFTTAVVTAYEHHLPLYVFDDSEAYYIAVLLREGFVTQDPELSRQRVFTRADGAEVTLIEPEKETIGMLEETLPPPRAVIVGEPSTLRAWYIAVPDALEMVGATTAIFNTPQEEILPEGRE